ncbi:hypothetical protein PsAD2_00764 [Pseudovibrio axinellae]|uniref:DUF4142 domain-containing protein n=1 Tax=Pseudovibrio axinellae TaxID=989403 RepID=A0A161V8Z7_9HYPH|nr:DUF4142 domain-containing protein [Pseudovibrio axinellae]KZL21469.1 hypothetical protein PsAD2_00764 [Pseudovibrio axinellae]SER06366.1 putative membrane protein [Pseudovibrio axinellae]
MNIGKLHITRRNAFFGLSGTLLAAPALVTAASADSHSASEYTTKTLTISPFSLAISDLAMKKASNPMVQLFAKLEAGEQTAVSQVIVSTGATPPARPAALENIYQKLDAASGADFDRLYISTEITGHEELLSVQLPEAGKKPVNVDVATATILVPFIHTHLAMLSEIQKQLG